MPTKGKSSAKKPSTKKPTKKVVKKASKTPDASQLHVGLTKDTDKFWNFKFTIQSVYWIAVGIAVIGTAIINYTQLARTNELLQNIQNEQDDQQMERAHHRKDTPKHEKSEATY